MKIENLFSMDTGHSVISIKGNENSQKKRIHIKM